MCKSLTNYFPRNNDFLVTYFGKTQIILPPVADLYCFVYIPRFSNCKVKSHSP